MRPTGARYRSLDLPEFGAFAGAGGHYAASSIEARLSADEEVAVIGGGNSAGQAAVFLSQPARHVHMLVRGKGLADTMSDYLVGRIAASRAITLRTRTEIVGLRGDRRLETVAWRDRDSGETTFRSIRQVFLMIGAVPNTEWLDGCVKLDGKGFVCVGGGVGREDGWKRDRQPYIFETNRPGVFAVGDVRADSVKRVASAVGEGSVAVQFIHRVLDEFRTSGP